MRKLLPSGSYKIPSESRENREYTITIKGRSVRCSCPGFRRHNHCKHADAMKRGEYAEVAA